MEIFLPQESYSALNLLSALSLNSWGILIGHERGNAVIVEKIISLGSTFPKIEQIPKINELVENKLIGFFTFEGKEKTSFKWLLTPLNAGLILLRISKKKKENLQINADLIDFKENNMILTPIKVKKL